MGSAKIDSAYPGFRQALWLLLGVTLLTFVAGLPLGILAVISGSDVWRNPAVWPVMNVVGLGGGVLWGLRKRGIPARDLYPFRPFGPRLVVPGILCVLAASILTTEAGSVVQLWVPMSDSTISSVTEIALGKTSLWGTLYARSVVAPLTEELLFRGLILGGFLHRYSPTKAVLYSASLFALFHLDPSKLVPAFGGGVLFGWLFVRTGSLIPCIAAHAIHNGAPVLLIEVLRPLVSQEELAQIDLTKVEFLPLWVTATVVVVLGLSIWWFEREVRSMVPRAQAGGAIQ